MKKLKYSTSILFLVMLVIIVSCGNDMLRTKRSKSGNSTGNSTSLMCSCQVSYQPVCGTLKNGNGESYHISFANICIARCNNSTTETLGNCTSGQKGFFNSQSSVCGIPSTTSTQVTPTTYASDNARAVANAAFLHFGQCQQFN